MPLDNKICLVFFPNFKENTAIFPNSKGPSPSPKKGCESPDIAEIAQDTIAEISPNAAA